MSTAAPLRVLPTGAAPAPPASAPAPPQKAKGANREGQLDAMRAIATVRVVLWHTFASPWLSFTVASMPTMFFVAGSLMAASLDRRPPGEVLIDRLRRLLVPFWAFGAFVWVVLGLAHVHGTDGGGRITLRMLLPWLVPVVAPKGTAWEGGWLSQPLWYLRTLVWLFVLSPVLRAITRHGKLLAVAVPAAGVFLVDRMITNPATAPAGFSHLRWFAGDMSLYSIFLMLGFMHRDGYFRSWNTRMRTEMVMLATCVSVLWCTRHTLPGGVVNNSYPAHLVVGLTWLFVAIRLEGPLEGLSRSPVAGPLIRFLTQRALTIYLWHTTAIVAATWMLERLAPGAPRIAVLAIIPIPLAVAIALTGWVEDLAARRGGRLWPGRLPFSTTWRPTDRTRARFPGVFAGIAVGLVLAIVAMAALEPVPAARAAAADTGAGGATEATATTAAAAKRPAPSARPDLAVFDGASTTTVAKGAATTTTATPAAGGAASATTVPGGGAATTAPSVTAGTTATTAATAPGPAAKAHAPVDAALAAKLQAATDTWRNDLQVKGMVIGIELPNGSRWVAASGNDADTNKPMDVAKPFAITSLTKTFTAALGVQLVGEGKLSLDDPIPTLAKAADFPYAGKLTMRQLLSHTSGLDTYQETPEYKANPGMTIDPVIAVKMAGTRPLLWDPGTNVGYSSSGYLLAGLLEEQAGGAGYVDQITNRFIKKLGMTKTTMHEEKIPGWIGFSTGGLWSTTDDLLTWGTNLYRDKTALGPELTATMLNIDNKFSVGLGAWPVCPCSTGPAGEKIVTSIGHNGGSATLQYSPADGLVMTTALTESIFDRITQQDVYELFAQLREIVAAKA